MAVAMMQRVKLRQESMLQVAVQDLISPICNVKTMEEAVMEMKYDIRRGPLDKITVVQIKAGYAALNTISVYLEAGITSGEEIIQQNLQLAKLSTP